MGDAAHLVPLDLHCKTTAKSCHSDIRDMCRDVFVALRVAGMIRAGNDDEQAAGHCCQLVLHQNLAGNGRLDSSAIVIKRGVDLK